jgi:hypothetical protein
MNEENAQQPYQPFKAVLDCGFYGLKKHGSYALFGGRFGACEFSKAPY